MIDWVTIKAALDNGETVEEIANQANSTYKNMWNRIRRHEVKDGVIYMKEEHLRPLKNRNSKRAKAPERCPVTKKPRSPEECAECYESDCKGKEAPEKKPEFLTKTFHFPKESCIHMEICNSFGTGKCTAACNNYQPDNPRDLLPVVKAEAVPIHCKPGKGAAVDWNEIQELEKAGEEANIEVTPGVYAEIERQIDHCEEMIQYAKRTCTQMEKERDAWAAILATIKTAKSEDIPEGVT